MIGCSQQYPTQSALQEIPTILPATQPIRPSPELTCPLPWSPTQPHRLRPSPPQVPRPTTIDWNHLSAILACPIVSHDGKPLAVPLGREAQDHTQDPCPAPLPVGIDHHRPLHEIDLHLFPGLRLDPPHGVSSKGPSTCRRSRGTNNRRRFVLVAFAVLTYLRPLLTSPLAE
jgi:hypothetical protein